MSEPIRRYSVPQVERLSELNRWCRDEDVAALEARLETALRAIELARRELGSYRAADDEVYVRNANTILAAAQKEEGHGLDKR